MVVSALGGAGSAAWVAGAKIVVDIGVAPDYEQVPFE